MIIKLTHVALHAQNIGAVSSFYTDYCNLELVHEREDAGVKVVWLAEPGRGEDFVFVLIGGGAGKIRHENDFGHFGFTLESREAVDKIAANANSDGCLVWPARQEPPPIGDYCSVSDPDGNIAEFSFGQPLGMGLGTGIRQDTS